MFSLFFFFNRIGFDSSQFEIQAHLKFAFDSFKYEFIERIGTDGFLRSSRQVSVNGSSRTNIKFGENDAA